MRHRAAKNGPQGLTVLTQHLTALVSPPCHLLHLLPQDILDKGVRADGDTIAHEAWLKHPIHEPTSTLEASQGVGWQLTRPSEHLRLGSLEHEVAPLPHSSGKPLNSWEHYVGRSQSLAQLKIGLKISFDYERA